MKFIIMCGGNYPSFGKRKQLLEVNGEVLVERTIRLLRKYGIEDIAISTNCNDFDYLELPVLMQNNQYIHNGSFENKKSECCWLNAYYLLDEPCCYLYGDVYYSDNAIKIIIDTKVKDTMFFCIRDLQDGRKTAINAKGREPLAYKVENYKLFQNAISNLLRMVDEGKFENALAPFSWHLYRYLNGLNYISNNLGYINNIFNTKGDYIVIDDYSTDIDSIEDIEKLEKFLKIIMGGYKMVKAEVIEQFRLGRFNELKNIIRNQKDINHAVGMLYYGDIFECTEEMADYLTGNNPLKRAFVKVLEVIPEEVTEEVVQAVAATIVEEAEEKNKEVKQVVKEIIDESKEKKIKKTTKRNTKKSKE